MISKRVPKECDNKNYTYVSYVYSVTYTDILRHGLSNNQRERLLKHTDNFKYHRLFLPRQ